ncbi:hypothetical protein LSAT2_010319, partial [Lamellibrachia satsuma]
MQLLAPGRLIVLRAGQSQSVSKDRINVAARVIHAAAPRVRERVSAWQPRARKKSTTPLETCRGPFGAPGRSVGNNFVELFQYVDNNVVELFLSVDNNVVELFQSVDNNFVELFQYVDNNVVELFQSVDNNVVELFMSNNAVNSRK